MNTGLIGLYGLYLVFVGYKGNTSELLSEFEHDAKGFLPWLISIVVLKSMSENKNLAKFVVPFSGLAILSFSLINYDKIAEQLNTIMGKNYLPLSKQG